jgi:hypothetical protein
LRETLKSARRALAKWNFGEVNRQLARADGLAHTDTQRVIVNGMRDLAQHTRRFHEAIQKAAQNLKAGTELKVGDDILSMVEANRDRIVVRHKGANRRFALDELPPDLAMALGEKGMSADEPMAVLRKAAYVAVSARSDAATARAREMLVAESRKMPEVQRIIDALDESSDSKASESRGVSPTKANSTGSR